VIMTRNPPSTVKLITLEGGKGVGKKVDKRWKKRGGWGVKTTTSKGSACRGIVQGKRKEKWTKEH